MDSSGQGLAAAPPLPGLLPGLAGSLSVSLISLAVVCLLAYLGLKFLSRRNVGRVTGAIRVVARCPLEPRRSLYLVETAGRCFLVGVGDGPMTMLAELGPLDLSQAGTADSAPPSGAVAPPSRFSAALERALGRRSGAP